MPADHDQVHSEPGTVPVGVIYAIALVLAACSLLYELLIAQTLTLLAGNMVVWYSLTIGTYLGAMGIGAILYDRRPPRNGWSALYLVELLLSLVGALAVPALQLAHAVHLHLSADAPHTVSRAAFFILTFLIIVAVGILTGVELPLLIRLANEGVPGGNVTNRVLAWDYIGALAGGVLFPLVMVPRLEILNIGLATSSVNLAMALVVLFVLPAAARRTGPRVAMSAALVLLLLAGYMSSGRIQQYFLRKYYYYIEASASGAGPFSPLSDMPEIARASSAYQKIDLIQDPVGHELDILIDAYSTKFIEHPSKPKHRYLSLNGDIQVASNYEEFYHEWFAHVPIITNGHVPQRVLVLGAGDGLLIRELIKHEAIRSIIHIDIDPVLVAMAHDNPVLTALNENSLEDPRVDARLGDAFQFLRHNTERFDAIYLDFPYPMDYNLSKLYSREFYHFLLEAMADDGYAVLDAPGAEYLPSPDADEEDVRTEWEIYHHTLRKAGFRTVLTYYTNLEIENPKAYEILERSWIEAKLEKRLGRRVDIAEARQLWMEGFVAAQVDRLQRGFILLRKDDGPPNFEYEDLGIKLHALNAERFRLAFARPVPRPATIHDEVVNSILRPTMPITSPWSVRSPW